MLEQVDSICKKLKSWPLPYTEINKVNHRVKCMGYNCKISRENEENLSNLECDRDFLKRTSKGYKNKKSVILLRQN